MSKLVKQFKRELKTNPKKVGMLGLLVVVCGWFWGPLLFPKEDDRRPKPSSKPTVATAAPSSTGPTVAAASASAWRWQDLAAQIDADPRMRSLRPDGDDAAARNPFTMPLSEADFDAEVDALIAEVVADAEAEALAEAAAAVPPAPAYFDRRPLLLSSTIVGGGRRKAIINGQAFAEGSTLGSEDGRAMVLTAVEARRAIIEWNGHRRELTIPRPGESATE
jgi:hypothetical protein